QDGLLEARHPAVQRPEFIQDLGELCGALMSVPGVLRHRLLRFRAQLLHGRGKLIGDLDLRRALHRAEKNLRIASTNPGMSWRRASIVTSSPWSRAVFDVIGPILATCIWAGHGNPSVRKFSTVDEL